MSEQPERERDRERPAPAREPYAPPRLVRHGTIDELTGGVQSVLIGDATSTLT